jgi:adenosylcobinamide kinase/adenosylcobinamide-phosphate guanylyltransferase
MTTTSPGITLILGGAKSGKTRRALGLCEQAIGPVAYVATCPRSHSDSEMLAKISAHELERPPHMRTIEGTITQNLFEVAAQHKGSTLIVDCLTMWLYAALELRPASDLVPQLISDLTQSVSLHSVRWIIVSNEIGFGVIPFERETRKFRDLAGSAHAAIGQIADQVEIMVAGIPLKVR